MSDSKIVFLDGGFIEDVFRGGPKALHALESAVSGTGPVKFMTTTYVVDELPTGVQQAFNQWRAGRVDVEIRTIPVDLNTWTQEKRDKYGLVEENGRIKQKGDASLKVLEESVSY